MYINYSLNGAVAGKVHLVIRSLFSITNCESAAIVRLKSNKPYAEILQCQRGCDGSSLFQTNASRHSLALSLRFTFTFHNHFSLNTWICVKLFTQMALCGIFFCVTSPVTFLLFSPDENSPSNASKNMPKLLGTDYSFLNPLFLCKT